MLGRVRHSGLMEGVAAKDGLLRVVRMHASHDARNDGVGDGGAR
jgi:hypothetical protein